MFLFGVLLISLTLSGFLTADAQKCDEIIKSKSKTFSNQTCHNKWSNIKSLVKPTQSNVGYAWVQKKTDDYQTKKKAQATMDANPIPVVIGPDHHFYVVDQHHELSAFDYSGFTEVSVTLNVICDHRLLPTMETFWLMMEQSHLVYLGSLTSTFSIPALIKPNQLPQTFSFTKEAKSFGNDPWRSLASFARKVNSHYLDSDDCSDTSTQLCYRAYYRGCGDGSNATGPGVAFFEFRWGYFFVTALTSPDPNSYWPSTQSAAFNSSFNEQVNVEMGSYDLTQWGTIASLLIPLARSESAKTFLLPTDIFHTSLNAHLPGYVSGNTQILNDDPNCSPPSCSVAAPLPPSTRSSSATGEF
jgi:hypothetical protein